MLNYRTLTFVMAAGLSMLFALSACQPPAGNSDNTACAEPEEAEEECGDGGSDENTSADSGEDAYPFQLNAELAQLFFRYRMYDKAVSRFELAIEQQLSQTNRETPEYYIGLGRALEQAEEGERAREAYEKALDIWKRMLPNARNTIDRNKVITEIMKVCGTLGLEDEHARYLQKLSADDDNARQHLELAQIMNEAGHRDRAENHFKRVLELTAESPVDSAVAQLAYGRVLMSQERYGEALPLLESAALEEKAPDATRRIARDLIQNLCEVEGEEHKEVRGQARSLMLQFYAMPNETETE